MMDFEVSKATFSADDFDRLKNGVAYRVRSAGWLPDDDGEMFGYKGYATIDICRQAEGDGGGVVLDVYLTVSGGMEFAGCVNFEAPLCRDHWALVTAVCSVFYLVQNMVTHEE